MWGWILLGLAAATVGVIVIRGTINESRIKEEMHKENINKAVVTAIDNCTNTVKIQDLCSDKTLEIQGDDVDSDLNVHDVVA